MLYMYHFDLSILLTKEVESKLIEYKLYEDVKLQKNLIEELKIPKATFTRAKRSGFANNKRVYEILCKHYGIWTPTDEEVENVSKIIDELFTIIYYNRKDYLKEIYDHLLLIVPSIKNSILEIPVWCGLAISMNVRFFSKNVNLLSRRFEMMNYFKDLLPIDFQLMIKYSLFNYSILSDNALLNIKYSRELEKISTHVPHKLQIYVFYSIMKSCYVSKDYLKGIVYAIKCIDFQREFFSPIVRTMAKNYLIIYYSFLKDYDRVIEIGKSEILCLQFDDSYQIEYFSVMFSLITAHIMKEKYKDALDIIRALSNYNFLQHTKLSGDYIEMLTQKISSLVLFESFIYYKIRDYEKYTQANERIMNFKNAIYDDYLKIINYLSLGNKSNLKKASNLLDKFEKLNPKDEVLNLLSILKYEYEGKCISFNKL